MQCIMIKSHEKLYFLWTSFHMKFSRTSVCIGYRNTRRTTETDVERFLYTVHTLVLNMHKKIKIKNLNSCYIT